MALCTPEQRQEATKRNNALIAEFIAENAKNRGSFIKRIPKSVQLLFIAAYGKKSKAKAIKAKCLDCVCFDKVEVTNCVAVTCPLWEIRPYQK